MKYVGLLRGINVGGHGKLPMRALLDICDDLGFQNTRHYIQSGNVVFESNVTPENELLSQAIYGRHGLAPKVMFFRAEAFVGIAQTNPFADLIRPEKHKYLQQIMFTDTPAHIDLDQIKSSTKTGEKWEMRKNCFDLYAPEGVHKSKLARDIERILGVDVTARNWNTVAKLVEMVEVSS